MILPAPDVLPEKKEQPVPESSRAAVAAGSKGHNRRWVRITGCIVCVICVLLLVLYGYYARVIDRRLQGGPFADSVNVYAAPAEFVCGRRE